MTPARREALCAFLDAAAEDSADLEIRLVGIAIEVPHEEWPTVCELLEVDGRATSVVAGPWQGRVTVEATRLPEPKKSRRRAGAPTATNGEAR